MAQQTITQADFADNSQASQTAPQQGKITAKRVKDLFEKGSRATRVECRNAWINRSFLANEQWVVWNEQLRRPQTAPPPADGRLRLTFDRLLPSTRTLIAKLLRRPLVFEVPPSAADDESVRGARIGVAVLSDLHREQNWEGLREENFWATFEGGTGVLAIDWDPAAGQPLGQTAFGKSFGTGDVVVSSLSIPEVVTQPGARDVERAHWWIKAVALPPEVVQATYKLAKLPKADATAAMSPLQFKLLRDDKRDEPIELTLVLTYYERPTQVTKGQTAVVVGDEIVDDGGWPFPFKDRLNLVCTRETRRIGTWTGDTVLSKAISPQVALNHVWSAIVEHSKKAGNARMFVPEGALDPDQELSDEPGEIVRYHAAPSIPPPSYQAPPTLPQYLNELPDRLSGVIDDILGVHDVSRGVNPSGVHAGVALQLLADNDDTPMGRMAKELAEAWGRLATMVLEVYEAKVTEGRQAKVSMPGQRPEVVGWTGKSLAGQTDAEVPLESVQPRSRTVSLQLAVQLAQLYPGQLPLSIFANIAELPGQDDLIAGLDPNVEKARRENHEMGIGIVCVPADFDNHATHIDEHNRFRLSARYESLPDQMREAVDQHVQAHQTLAAEEAGAQAAKAAVNPALAAAAQGGQPPGSAGGPPTMPAPMQAPGGPQGAPPDANAPSPDQQMPQPQGGQG